MKAGDLISFKPIHFGLEEWSNPSIVVSEYTPPNEGLWVVWVDNVVCTIDTENYEIAHLTNS